MPLGTAAPSPAARPGRSALVVTLTGTLLLTGACFGSDDPAPPAVRGLTAERVDGGGLRLTWERADEVEAYQIHHGGTVVEVPEALCDQVCGITLAPDPRGGAGEAAVRGVRAGAVSEAATVPVEPAVVTAMEPEVREVLLVYAGTPPVTETVAVSSVDEAESVIADARAAAADEERVLLSANLNSSSRPSASQADPPAPAAAAWQAEAMEFSRLPGDPPGDGVVVAILEQGGVDSTHPALAGAAIEDGFHVGESGSDGRSTPNAHANGVASMIVGQPDGLIPGIAPGVTLLPVNIGDARESDLIEATRWAVDNGADVINVSQAMGDCGLLDVVVNCRNGLQQAAEYAESNGVVVVAGAGNNGPGSDRCTTPTNADIWPAVLDTVISVGGHTSSGDRWACSPDRPDVDLLAPSADLVVADGDRGYRVGHGTSFASPLVAGLIAVALAERPELTPAEIRAMLPQWVRADGGISVFAALVTLGIIDWDPPLDLDSVERAYPYHVDLRFPADHPVSVAMADNQVGTLAWIDGVVFIREDGSATASGVMEFQYKSGNQIGGPEWTARASRFGYAYECPRLQFVPDGWEAGLRVERRLRWSIPVTVDAELVPGTPEQPEFSLSFSPGVGATATQPGSLPPVTVVRDTMDVCADYLEWFNSNSTVEFLSGVEAPEWGEVEQAAQEYFERVESALQLLLDGGPYRLAEPASSAIATTVTTVAGEEQVDVTYWDMHLHQERMSG